MKSKDSGKEESAPPLPHLDEAERGALGGMLLSPDAAGEIASLLSASDFFDFSHLHPQIFSAICKIFEEGQKIIQIVFLPIPEVELELTDSFEETERGENGFGSSGKF